MRPLQKGCQGDDVEDWQLFLIGQGWKGKADRDFGAKTHRATVDWQKKNKLVPADGIVANDTLRKALECGFHLVEMEPQKKPAAYSPAWPPPPLFKPLVGNVARQKIFGRFKWTHQPTKGNPEHIIIHGGWAAKNIVTVEVPQLVTAGVRKTPRVRVHRKIAKQFVDLWAAWEEASLLPYVLTWNGSFVPRLSRGSTKSLSNHSFGSAFDINVKWNRLGHTPARTGTEGSVRELVPIANKYGFYWGGHYKKRKDGMHFEAAKILS